MTEEGPRAAHSEPVDPTGQSRWDGTQWVPNTPPTAAPTQSWPPPPMPPVPPAGSTGWQQPPVPTKPGRGLAIAGFTVAIIGVVFGIIPLLFFLALTLGVLGLVFGILGRRHGLGKAAIVLAIIAIGLGIAGVVIVSNAANDINKAVNPSVETTETAPNVTPAETAPSVPTTEEPTPPASQPPSVDSIPGSVDITQDDQPAGTVAITSVKSTRQSNVDYGTSPANGYFVTFTVRVDSKIDGLDIGEPDFYTVVGGRHYDVGNGHVYGGVNTDNQLSYTTLNASEHAQGTISFDVPSPHGMLQYSPNYQSAPIASWKY